MGRTVLLDNSDDKTSKAKCIGVKLANRTEIKAKQDVVSNKPLWNYACILEDFVEDLANDNSAATQAVHEEKKQADSMTMTWSFMHLHHGIPKDSLPKLECHHSILNSDLRVTDKQNMLIISIPTVFDPDLALEGDHILHAYTAASDKFDEWAPFQEETGKVGSSPYLVTSQAYGKRACYKELKAKKGQGSLEGSQVSYLRYTWAG
jgi:hypothetical protein